MMTSSSKITVRVLNVRLLVVFSAAIALLGCASGEGTTAPIRELGRVGNIQLVAEPTQAVSDKIIVVSFLFRDTGVDVIEVRVAFGSTGAQASMAKDFILRLADASGATLAEYGVMDPRRVVVESQGLVELEQTVHVARFRFHREARQVLVLDPEANILTKSDLGPAISEFCERRKDDPDCQK